MGFKVFVFYLLQGVLMQRLVASGCKIKDSRCEVAVEALSH